MHILPLFSFLCCLLSVLQLVESTISLKPAAVCPLRGVNVSIAVVVIDESSRVEKEQIAMKLAVQDLRHCLNLVLHIKDSHANSAPAVYAGGEQNVLKIGVPARCVFNQFVKVTNDWRQNKTQITGFSIEVFKAAVKQLPYDLNYEFIPYHGSYDEMVAQVHHNKSLDAVVGDTDILADRYVYAEFSQPYMESGLVMVVTVKPGLKESNFIALKPFTEKMWLQFALLRIATGAIVWLSEFATANEQFTNNSILENICSILWLSVTIISFSQKENIKSTASKLVLGAWIYVVFVVGASFTAVLSSMMTVPRLEPSIQDIDTLLNSNAVVGCNVNSFIANYLINVLHFKPHNVINITSINQYPKAFQSGKIKAAFFTAPHAKVFLAEYSNASYIISKPSFKLGGFGFVFQKGSPLAIDISEAILKLTQNGYIDNLEQNMLSSNSNRTSSSADDIILGPGPFSGLFLIQGCILGFAFIVAIARLARTTFFKEERSVEMNVARHVEINGPKFGGTGGPLS